MSHRRILQVITIAALTLLVSWGSIDPPVTALGDAPQRTTSPVAVATDVESCPGIGDVFQLDVDVFQLDVPGTYAAFATSSSGSLLTEVRGGHGQLLATSNRSMADTTVDFASALRFGIAPPQVFEVESSVDIVVQHDNSPYELVLVRVDGTSEFRGSSVRPPVETIVNESGSCLIGDLRETFKIHTEAVDSETGARRVFLVDSPHRLVDH